MATQNIWLHQQLKVSCEYLEYLFSYSRSFILLRSEKLQSRPVSRVLSWTVIHLGLASPLASSNLPESDAGRTNGFLFGLAPNGVYHAADCYQLRGALLPHLFTLTGNGLQAVCFLLHFP